MTPTAHVGVLLAAGDGKRFGTDKRVATLANGRPIIAQAAQHLIAALPRSFVVLRPGDERLGVELAALGLQVVINPDAERGIGSSLACGVTAAADAAGWVVALADMPFIRARTIAAVGAALDPASIAVPRFRGARGHPVGFGHRFGVELRQLDGDVGARDLLTRHRSACTWVDCDDPGVVTDIDRVEDLARVSGGENF